MQMKWIVASSKKENALIQFICIINVIFERWEIAESKISDEISEYLAEISFYFTETLAPPNSRATALKFQELLEFQQIFIQSINSLSLKATIHAFTFRIQTNEMDTTKFSDREYYNCIISIIWYSYTTVLYACR